MNETNRWILYDSNPAWAHPTKSQNVSLEAASKLKATTHDAMIGWENDVTLLKKGSKLCSLSAPWRIFEDPKPKNEIRNQYETIVWTWKLLIVQSYHTNLPKMLGHQQLTTSRRSNDVNQASKAVDVSTSVCVVLELFGLAAGWSWVKNFLKTSQYHHSFLIPQHQSQVTCTHLKNVKSFFWFGIYRMNFWKEFPKISFWRNSVVISDNSQIYVLQKESHSETFSLCCT